MRESPTAGRLMPEMVLEYDAAVLYRCLATLATQYGILSAKRCRHGAIDFFAAVGYHTTPTRNARLRVRHLGAPLHD